MNNQESTKWMKWRHTFAGNTGSWDWIEVADDEAIKYVLSELSGEYSYSEHYRGIEYDLYDSPDLEWLEAHLEQRREDLHIQGRRIERLEGLFLRLQNVESNGAETITSVELVDDEPLMCEHGRRVGQICPHCGKVIECMIINKKEKQ